MSYSMHPKGAAGTAGQTETDSRDGSMDSNNDSNNNSGSGANAGGAEDSSIKKWGGDLKTRLDGSLTARPHEALLVMWVAHGVFPVFSAVIGILMYCTCEKYPVIHRVTKHLLNLYILWVLAWLIGSILCFLGGLLSVVLIGIPILIIGALVAAAGVIHMYVNVIMGVVAAVQEKEFKPWLSPIKFVPEDDQPDAGSNDKQDA